MAAPVYDCVPSPRLTPSKPKMGRKATRKANQRARQDSGIARPKRPKVQKMHVGMTTNPIHKNCIAAWKTEASQNAGSRYEKTLPKQSMKTSGGSNAVHCKNSHLPKRAMRQMVPVQTQRRKDMFNGPDFVARTGAAQNSRTKSSMYDTEQSLKTSEDSNATSKTRLPNIAISGTPGVGKTTLAKALVAALRRENRGFYHLDFANGEDAKPFYTEYDETLKTWVIDEEARAASLREKLMEEGGAVIDWMHADMFDAAPDGPIDCVVTVKLEDTRVLYDRLKARGYSARKLEENMDAEIMGQIAEENRENLREGKTASLIETICLDKHGLENTVGVLESWVAEWRQMTKARGVPNGAGKLKLANAAEVVNGGKAEWILEQ